MEQKKDKKENSFQLLDGNKKISIQDSDIEKTEKIHSNISQSNRSAPENVGQNNENLFAQIPLLQNKYENEGQQNFELHKKLCEDIENDKKNDNINNTIINNSNKINENMINNKLNQNKNNNLNNIDINNENINNINPIYVQSNSDYLKDNPSIKKTRLSDLGKKSYLNSILQCLADVDELSKYFLNEYVLKDILNSVKKTNTKKLSFAIQRLFVHKDSFHDIIYKPESILDVLKKRNIIFNREHSEISPNNCLNYILNEIHDELNWKKENNNYKDVNQYNEFQVIQNSQYNFELSNDSIISNTFSIFCLKEINCLKCQNRKFQFQNYLTFDLDVLGFFNKMKKNRIRIYDCLDFAFRKKVKSNVYCESCNGLNESESFLSIINKPKRLVFMLDRGNFDKQLMDLNFYVDNVIGLEQYMTHKHSNVKYELKGIVSIFENRYISFIKSDEQFWYLFNDSNVNKVKNDDVINNNNSIGIKHIPCILFYKLIPM